MARRRKRIDETTRARWAEECRAYMEKTPAKPDRVAARRAPAETVAAPVPAPSYVQMCTVMDLPPNISMPLTAPQRAMLWAAWNGELWRDDRGVSIAGRRASIVTLRALRERGLVEHGGGQVGITQSGEVALELLYTDPRQWPTPIEAITGSLHALPNGTLSTSR